MKQSVSQYMRFFWKFCVENIYINSVVDKLLLVKDENTKWWNSLMEAADLRNIAFCLLKFPKKSGVVPK